MVVMSCSLPRNAKAEVRAVTFKPGMRVSALMISSAKPSLKYSSSGPRLIFANGSTAIDGGHDLGETEVEQLCRPVRRDHHIRRFQVAMEEAMRVCFYESAGDLNCETDASSVGTGPRRQGLPSPTPH
jgi:hypothetical protein